VVRKQSDETIAKAGGSPRRRGQGRSLIIQAAYRLFVEQGYDAVTMQAIADAAGVAVQTVYYLFGTKAALLAEVETHAVLGDRPAKSWRDAPWADEFAQLSDPVELIRRFVAADTQIKSRLATFTIAVGPALPNGPETQAGRQARREEFFRFVVDRISALGELKPDLSPQRGFEIVCIVNSLHNYVVATSQYGWTSHDWEQWLCHILTEQLLRHGPPRTAT